MTRVLIYGPRDFDDRRMLKVVLDRLHKRLCFTVVIETDEPGLARMAGDWAHERGLEGVKFPPEHKLYRKAARRHNHLRMIAEGRPDVVIAYLGGEDEADTRHLIARASMAGVDVYTVRETMDWGRIFNRRKTIEKEDTLDDYKTGTA